MKIYHKPEETYIYINGSEYVIRSLGDNYVNDHYRNVYSPFERNLIKAFDNKYKQWKIYPATVLRNPIK